MAQDSMKSHARVVIIGGGIAGCSTLYHLTQQGWSDVVLVERDELTSGSTWHAAAQVTQFGANQTMIAMKRHSIELYRKLSEDEEHPFAYHISGGMRLAHTPAQVDTYNHFIGMAAGVGVELEFIDGSEVTRRHPLINNKGLLGAWWDPLDGDIDPAGITFALARHARRAGAAVYRFNAVESITHTPQGEFIVHTQKGDITCEKVVNAAGYRVNEIGNMLGVSHPVTSMEHMYFLTESMPEIETLDFRLPVVRDPGDDFYTRQEKHGLLVGVYEQGCKTFGIDGIDPDFTQSLCPSDLDRCLDNMGRIFERMPALSNTGIHTVVNGPITYTIDGAPLVGPIPGLQNAYCAVGLRAGIGESGGLGKILAEIIVHGECEWDAWYLDPRRFTQYASTELTRVKAIEDYQNEFHYHLPHEYRPAGRLARTTPLYTELDDADSAWGVVNGWERVLFFKPDASFVDEPGFRFSATEACIEKEVNHLVKNVSIMEVSGFNRYEISGTGAQTFLSRMSCSKIPSIIGKVGLCYFLSDNGNVLSEATIIKLGDEKFWYGSAAASEWHDRDWLVQHKDHEISVTEHADSHTTLVLAGPKARVLLARVAPRTDWSTQAFPWLTAKYINIAHASMLAMNVSFSGESSFELHVPNASLLIVWRTLQDAGPEVNLGRFGLYATESMRLEKGYLHWKSDLLVERNPMESGLAKFVDMSKTDFVGRNALLEQLEHGPQKTLVVMTIDCEHAPAHAGDPVYSDGKQIGSITSSGFGHRVQKNIGYAYVDPSFAETSTNLSVGILGEQYNAIISEPVLYDPTFERARS